MIESPLQILRERVLENVKIIFNTLSSPKTWVRAFLNQFKR